MEDLGLLGNIGTIFGLLLFLIFIGMHIGIAMALTGIVAMVFLVGSGSSLAMLGLLQFNTLADTTR